MNASASSFEALHCSTTDFVKDYIFRNAVSKDTLIRALQGHSGFKQPSLGSATVKIEELMFTRQIDVIKDICRWNHSFVALPQIPYCVSPSRSTATSTKRLFLLPPSLIFWYYSIDTTPIPCVRATAQTKCHYKKKPFFNRSFCPHRGYLITTLIYGCDLLACLLRLCCVARRNLKN